MPDQPNWKEFGKAGQDSGKDVPDLYDERYGHYTPDESMKPKTANPALPGTPSPFTVSKK